MAILGTLAVTSSVTYQQPSKHHASAAASRVSEPPEQAKEELKAEVEEEVTPQAPFSSLLPDKMLMPPLPSMADNFKLFQDLEQRVAEALQIPLQEMTESYHKLVDILHSSISSRVALPVNEALLNPTKVIWQTSASVPPTYKQADQKFTCQWKKGNFSSPACLPI